MSTYITHMLVEDLNGPEIMTRVSGFFIKKVKHKSSLYCGIYEFESKTKVLFTIMTDYTVHELEKLKAELLAKEIFNDSVVSVLREADGETVFRLFDNGNQEYELDVRRAEIAPPYEHWISDNWKNKLPKFDDPNFSRVDKFMPLIEGKNIGDLEGYEIEELIFEKIYNDNYPEYFKLILNNMYSQEKEFKDYWSYDALTHKLKWYFLVDDGELKNEFSPIEESEICRSNNTDWYP